MSVVMMWLFGCFDKNPEDSGSALDSEPICEEVQHSAVGSLFPHRSPFSICDGSCSHNQGHYLEEKGE